MGAMILRENAVWRTLTHLNHGLEGGTRVNKCSEASVNLARKNVGMLDNRENIPVAANVEINKGANDLLKR